MDTQIKKYAKEYAKDKAFAGRLLINTIGIVVMIIMIVSYSIADAEDELMESPSADGRKPDDTYVSDYEQENAGTSGTDTSGYGENADSYAEVTDGYGENAGTSGPDTGNYGENVGSYEEEADSYDEIGGDSKEEADSYVEGMEEYRDNLEYFLRYSYEDDVEDLVKCTGMYTHAKNSDIILNISIYSDFNENEVGIFEISDAEHTYCGVINISDSVGKYIMKLEDGEQHTMVFYTDGTNYYIYIHNMQYIYGYVESGLFVLTEN